jgi:hypothetical protein
LKTENRTFFSFHFQQATIQKKNKFLFVFFIFFFERPRRVRADASACPRRGGRGVGS